jgi:hypothetical protein
MKRIRRIAWLAGTALAALGFAFAGPRSAARAQYAQPAAAAPKASMPAPKATDKSTEKSADQSATKSAAMGSDKGMAMPAAPAASQAMPPAGPQAAPAGAEQGTPPGVIPMHVRLPLIEGEYDVGELRKLIQRAREAGFTEEQMHEITVDDAEGHTVNALEFLQAYDKRQKEEAARLEAERTRVYLTPKDITKELDKKQPQDLNRLRDRMLFVD